MLMSESIRPSQLSSAVLAARPAFRLLVERDRRRAETDDAAVLQAMLKT
jgi:hypothetical protein